MNAGRPRPRRGAALQEIGDRGAVGRVQAAYGCRDRRKGGAARALGSGPNDAVPGADHESCTFGRRAAARLGSDFVRRGERFGLDQQGPPGARGCAGRPTSNAPGRILFNGRAGEHSVASELLFYGFDARVAAVDEGTDIFAAKGGRRFLFQVKTSVPVRDKCSFFIPPGAHEKFGLPGAYYVRRALRRLQRLSGDAALGGPKARGVGPHREDEPQVPRLVRVGGEDNAGRRGRDALPAQVAGGLSRAGRPGSARPASHLGRWPPGFCARPEAGKGRPTAG